MACAAEGDDVSGHCSEGEIVAAEAMKSLGREKDTRASLQKQGGSHKKKKCAQTDPYALPDSNAEEEYDEGDPEVEKEDRKILAWTRKSGSLPCVIWRPKETAPTYCFKNLRTGRFRVSGGKDEMSASALVREYGPKGGEGSRNDVAIKIVKSLEEEAHLPHPADPSGHLSHGQWLEMYEKEMIELEKLYEQPLPLDKQSNDGKAPRKSVVEQRKTPLAARTVSPLPPRKGENKRRRESTNKPSSARSPVRTETDSATSKYGFSTADFLKLQPEVQLALVNGDTHIKEMRIFADTLRRVNSDVQLAMIKSQNE